MTEGTVRMAQAAKTAIEQGQAAYRALYSYLQSADLYRVDCVAFVLLMGGFIVISLLIVDRIERRTKISNEISPGRGVSNFVEKERVSNTR